MSFKKIDFTDFDDCLGSVNVLLGDRVVLQGRIIRDDCRKHVDNEDELITLELTCDAFIIRDNAQLKTISPTLFTARSKVRINVDDISAVGPSVGCPVDDAESDA